MQKQVKYGICLSAFPELLPTAELESVILVDWWEARLKI